MTQTAAVALLGLVKRVDVIHIVISYNLFNTRILILTLYPDCNKDAQRERLTALSIEFHSHCSGRFSSEIPHHASRVTHASAPA
jgi:hypothetical protein